MSTHLNFPDEPPVELDLGNIAADHISATDCAACASGDRRRRHTCGDAEALPGRKVRRSAAAQPGAPFSTIVGRRPFVSPRAVVPSLAPPPPAAQEQERAGFNARGKSFNALAAYHAGTALSRAASAASQEDLDAFRAYQASKGRAPSKSGGAPRVGPPPSMGPTIGTRHVVVPHLDCAACQGAHRRHTCRPCDMDAPPAGGRRRRPPSTMAHIGALQAIGQPVPLPLLALGLQALG